MGKCVIFYDGLTCIILYYDLYYRVSYAMICLYHVMELVVTSSSHDIILLYDMTYPLC